MMRTAGPRAGPLGGKPNVPARPASDHGSSIIVAFVPPAALARSAKAPAIRPIARRRDGRSFVTSAGWPARPSRQRDGQHVVAEGRALLDGAEPALEVRQGGAVRHQLAE